MDSATTTIVLGAFAAAFAALWAKVQKCEASHADCRVKTVELAGKLARLGATAAALKKQGGVKTAKIAALEAQNAEQAKQIRALEMRPSGGVQ